MNKRKINNTQSSDSALLHTISLKDLGVDAQKKDVSPTCFAVYIRSLLQNWRQGTVACKDRSEVAFSNKKPWKQKGTGRARAGSARSPLWRKGGVIFGPQLRTRTLKVAKKVKGAIMNNFLFDFVDSGKIAWLDWHIDQVQPKTSLAYNALKNAGITNERVTLFLPANDSLTYGSFANIPNVRILFFDQPNAFDLAKSDRWVFLKRDLDHFKGMVSQWL